VTRTELAGESVVLRPDRTLHWPARATLVLSDPHFGKAETFRAAGLPVPGGPDDALTRLGRALRETGAERMIVLGDFWHARAGRNERVVARLEQWRALHASVRVELVRGNHDRAGPPPVGWGLWRDDPWSDAPFVFAHVPVPSPAGYVLAGHVHPGVVLRGAGRDRLRLPCFRVGPRVTVLPAFGTFTGLMTDSSVPDDRVYVVADGDVLELPG
jgi:DNA ligase-associated metallophosphoesterase